MGSLMAGWDSPVSDPGTVKHERNRSLTKEEIDAFWRSKKQAGEEHLKAIITDHVLVAKSPDPESDVVTGSGRKLRRSSSLPLASSTKKQSFVEEEAKETDLGKLLKETGWWTRSNSAFLNEPPVIVPEGAANKYTSQFRVVATIATSKNGSRRITT